MKLVTKLNPSLCPWACEAVALLLLNAHEEGKDVVVFRALLYTAATDGIWHCAPLYKDEPYENTWTDKDFGL